MPTETPEKNELFTGVLGDPREDVRFQNGYSIDEVLAASSPINWVKKVISEVVQYPVWNQDRTLACVAFSKARQISVKIFELTGVWIDFSPASIYQLRSNAPGGGMFIPDANDIVNKRGVTLDALMKSQNLSEIQINTVKRTKIADLFANAISEAVVRYLYVPVDIDRIAQTIESKKAVSLLVFATYDEYSRMVPVVQNPNLVMRDAAIVHEVVGVDYFLDQDGVKRVYINDSAHFGGLAVRELTADFLHKRCVIADVLDVFTFEPGSEPEKPTFIEGNIISLQKCLRYEGLFPVGTDFVEIYGPITIKAVNAFQLKYGLATIGTGTVGPKTKAKLHELYP